MLKVELLCAYLLCRAVTHVMAGKLQLLHAIFVSTFTQEKLKKNV